MYELTNEEKISVIDQHLKSLGLNKYNLQVSLLELTAGPNIKEEPLQNLQDQIDTIAAQEAVLSAEKSFLLE